MWWCVVWCGGVVWWCGVAVWCGVVWWCGVVVVGCGVVWCGVVWCGVVWCGVVWCGGGGGGGVCVVRVVRGGVWCAWCVVCGEGVGVVWWWWWGVVCVCGIQADISHETNEKSLLNFHSLYEYRQKSHNRSKRKSLHDSQFTLKTSISHHPQNEMFIS